MTVTITLFVPANRHLVSLVGNRIERKVVPRVGCERIDDQSVATIRFQAGEAGDDEVVEVGVEVVLAAITHVVSLPRSGVGVECLGDVGLAVLAVGDGEGVQ